jgi:hypothetical protein
MGDPTSILENHEFVVDCARYAEGLLSEKEVKKKHHFDDDTWARLGENDALLEAIEAEKVRRIRDGSAKREKAQMHIVRGPDVLNGIMMDATASPKHRIDASKTLDQFAGNGPGATSPDSARFIIHIDLRGDIETYNKSRAIDANDVAPDHTSSGVVVAIPTKKAPNKIAAKTKDDDGGEPV